MQKNPSTQPKRRILVWLTALASVCLLLGLILLLTLGYLYKHPSMLKRLLQAGFERKTGLSLVIDEFDYTLVPGQLTARNIRIRPVREQGDDFLSIDLLRLDFNLTGPLGKRRLTVERLQLDNLTGRVHQPWQGLPLETASKSPSSLNRILLRSFRFFVFSTVHWRDIRASNGNFTLVAPSRQLHLNHIDIRTVAGDLLRVSANLRFEWPGARAVFTAESIQIDAENWKHADGQPVVLHCALSRGALQSEPIRISNIQMAAILDYNQGREEVRIAEAELSGGIAPRQSGPLPTIEWRLRAVGTYTARAKRADLTNWDVEVANIMVADGQAQIRMADSTKIQLVLSSGRLTLQNLLNSLDAFNIDRPPLNAAGEARFQGQVAVAFRPGAAPRIQGDLTADGNGLAISFQNGRHRLKAGVHGRIRAEEDLLNPRLQIQLETNNLQYRSAGVVLNDVMTKFAAAGRHPDFGCSFNIDIAAAELTLGRRKLRLENVALEAIKGRLQLINHIVDLPQIQFYSPETGRLQVGLAVDPSALRMTLSGKDSRLLGHTLQHLIMPDGWRIEARERFDVALNLNAHAAGQLMAQIHLKNLGFSNPDGSRIAENIQGRLEVLSEFESRRPGRNLRIQLTVPEGEILWDTHYLSFKNHPLAIAGTGSLDTRAASLRLDRLAVDMGDLISVSASGRLAMPDEKPVFDVSIRLPDTDVAPLFHALISEPYKFHYPAVAALEVNGTCAGSLDLKKDRSGWDGRGQVRWREGGLRRTGGGIVLEGVDLLLPILYRSGAPFQTTAPLKGNLHIRQLALPFVPSQDLALRFDVYPGSLVIAAPTPFDLKSGRAVLGPVRIDGLFTENQTVESRLSLQSVAIDAYLKDVWPKTTGGILQGVLTEIRLDRNNLTSRGELTVNMFGGEFRLQDPGIIGMFSSAPTLTMDARIINVDLGRLTENTAFGRIQGTLQGRVENLEIVNGQAQRFDLLLETVESEGVPRKINVKAIENIARLGGGQNPFVGLAGKALAVFDQFYYQKMGVQASLDNDVFRINGTLREGNKEFLVKKGGIPGVDVVNLNPDNRISFKDMLRRIQRIRSHRGGAVIR